MRSTSWQLAAICLRSRQVDGASENETNRKKRSSDYAIILLRTSRRGIWQVDDEKKIVISFFRFRANIT